MKKTPITQARLLKLSAVIALSILATQTSRADLFFTGDVNTDPQTAADGTFDLSTPAFQPTNVDTGSGSKVAYDNASDVQFQGGPTGATANVTFGSDNLTIPSLTFTAGAGTYNFTNPNSDIIAITGGGIINASANTQSFDIGGNPGFGGQLNFSNSATIGANVSIIDSTNNSLVNFGDSSSAGAASISGISSLNFNDGSSAGAAAIGVTSGNIVNFNNTSDAGSSTINIGSGGTVRFNDTATGGTATVNVNATDGALDVSQTAAPLGVTLDSLNTSGQVILGATKLTLTTTLTLNSGSALNIDLGAVSGAIDTANVTGGPTGSTLLNLTAVAGLAPGTYSIINFGTETGVDAADFTLGDISSLTAAGYTATVTVDGDSVDVNLTAVPEVSSFAMPIAGAAALLWFRRRKAAGYASALLGSEA